MLCVREYSGLVWVFTMVHYGSRHMYHVYHICNHVQTFFEKKIVFLARELKSIVHQWYIPAMCLRGRGTMWSQRW